MLDVEDLKLVIDDLRLLGEPPLLDAGELALDETSVAGLTLTGDSCILTGGVFRGDPFLLLLYSCDLNLTVLSDPYLEEDL